MEAESEGRKKMAYDLHFQMPQLFLGVLLSFTEVVILRKKSVYGIPLYLRGETPIIGAGRISHFFFKIYHFRICSNMQVLFYRQIPN